MICGPLQAMSLQIPIAEVKQATFPLWCTKGKGRGKGQGTCRDPSCMSSASAERGSLTFPESLLPSYRADAHSWEGWKGRPQEDHGPSQERACHQTSQSVPPLSHTVSSHGIRFAPTYPTPPSANSSPPCTPCCQHVGLREAEAGSETRLGVS